MDYKEKCRPKLKLFLSVDVIDSTAFKNQEVSQDQVQPWLPFFVDFYKSFPVVLFNHLLASPQKELKQPRLWKSIGDELVFVVELTNYKAACAYVRAFREAVNSYNEDLRGKDFELRLKATAWLAGFPVGNAQVQVGGEVGANKEEDYIGPQIDIGFRLTKFAQVRNFIVSLELALLLLQDTNPLKFYFDGLHVLKGVLRDRPYPIIWIDMLEGKKGLEQGLRGNPCDNNDLKDFCAEYIQRIGKPLMKPFITGDAEFHEKPSGYDEDLKKVAQLIADEDRFSSSGKEKHVAKPNGASEVKFEETLKFYEDFINDSKADRKELANRRQKEKGKKAKLSYKGKGKRKKDI